MKNSKGILLKLLLVLGSFLFTALLAEGIIRIFMPQKIGNVEFAYDKERGAIPVPNQCGWTNWPDVYSYTRCNNSLGLRGTKEYSYEKTSPRVLILGDSFTYGTGVNDDETFSAKLQDKFQGEVINAGNGGTGTDYALKFFEVLGKKYSPDVTLLVMFSNDYGDNARGVYFETMEDGTLKPKSLDNILAAKKGFLNNPVYDWLCAHSHLVNLLKSALVRAIANRGSESSSLYVAADPDALSEENQAATELYLGALEKEVRESGSKLSVFYIPSIREAEDYIRRGKVSEKEETLKDFLDKKKVPFTSTSELLKDSGKKLEDLYFIKEGTHWKPLAHEIFGDFLNSYLLGMYNIGK